MFRSFLKEDKGLDLEYKILRLNTSDCTKMFDFFHGRNFS